MTLPEAFPLLPEPELDPLDFYGVPASEQVDIDETEPNVDADNYAAEG